MCGQHADSIESMERVRGGDLGNVILEIESVVLLSTSGYSWKRYAQ